MTVKVRGRGRVEVLWQEDGWKEPELSLSDLSDGTIRLIAWLTLALSPDPPPLVCIDEPEEGVHPRTLPKLAGLFSKLAERTQVLLATHSSYFLLQFPLERIAVMRKVDGGGVFRKPADSKALCECLEDFGDEELEVMHRSGELEQLP
jgi:predicted ATPase